MQVKLLVSRSGPGISQNANEIINIKAAEGRRLIKAGQAVAVSQAKPQKVERKKKVETATRKRKSEQAAR